VMIDMLFGLVKLGIAESAVRLAPSCISRRNSARAGVDRALDVAGSEPSMQTTTVGVFGKAIVAAVDRDRRGALDVHLLSRPLIPAQAGIQTFSGSGSPLARDERATVHAAAFSDFTPISSRISRIAASAPRM
jgi:hypothetical protein